MREADIRKYAKLMKELELTGLEIRENDKVVRLERTPAVPAATVVPVPAEAPSYGGPVAEPAGDYVSVTSPMVGMFYAAPAENAEPFVREGDTVKKGDTLCIIEAMKLMNELTAETDGVVQKVCVQNGQVVDYGCELFRIRRT